MLKDFKRVPSRLATLESRDLAIVHGAGVLHVELADEGQHLAEDPGEGEVELLVLELLAPGATPLRLRQRRAPLPFP